MKTALSVADDLTRACVALGRTETLLPGGYAVYAPEGFPAAIYRVGPSPSPHAGGWDGDEYGPGLWPVHAVNPPGAPWVGPSEWSARRFLEWAPAIADALKE